MFRESTDTASGGDRDRKGGVFVHQPMVKQCFGESKHYLLRTSDVRGDHQAMLDSAEVRRRFGRALRANPALLLKDIAEACDVTPQAVGDWKRTGRIDKRHFQKLAELTHTSLDYWIGEHTETVEEITARAAQSTVGMAELLESIAVSQGLLAKALTESIPTAGRAFVDALSNSELRDREYVSRLLGELRRDLAKQDADRTSLRKSRGSNARKHP
jgi:transcriptional regulator with XRE-family HTH domain